MRLFLYPTVLILFVSFQQGFGQLRYGIHAGIGISNMSDVHDPPPALDINYYSAVVSFLGGVFGEVELSEKFSLHTELNYERRGADKVAFEPEYAVRFHYLSMPLQVKYTFHNDMSVRLGPQFNYALSISSDDELVPGAFLKEVYDEFDIGINLGVAYPLWEKLAVTARYYHGLTPLETFLFVDAEASSDELNFAKHRHWAIGLQYYIH